MSTPFSTGAQTWLGRLGNLRNVVRQEVIARQVAAHLPEAAQPLRVLDVGAGQGTQATWLARRGHQVVALEPDPHMRVAAKATRADEDPETQGRLRIVPGELGRLADSLADAGRPVTEQEHRFDVVLCHGVLMYLDDHRRAVAELAGCVAPGGLLSLVARNAEGLAMRHAMRGDWTQTLQVLDELAAAQAEQRDPRYVNEIGVPARADRTETLAAALRVEGLAVEGHYGVRIASDTVPLEEPTPDDDELERVIEAELRLGAVDPYRRVASLVHLVGRRA